MAQHMIKFAWDAKAGFFWARRNGSRVNVRTPFSLFPLITGQMPPEISNRLVMHLMDERQFWSRYPVPTVAMDDPKYNPYQMWRGPTWVNVNYLLIEGLERSGYPAIARELRQRTLDLICCRNDIYEYYHPVSGENPPQAAPMFGWSSAVFIDLAIQAAREKSQ
jgi:glycogen debranching enzyme